MMDKVKAQPLAHGRITPVPGMCSKCSMMRMVHVIFCAITMDGVTPRLEFTACAVCSLIAKRHDHE